MEKFVRPVLCRLCECPAGSDGVRMSDVDVVKLSRWWRKALDTELEDEELEGKILCQFCLWDAKFQGELEACDWWTGHDTNKFFEKFFYKERLLQPCAVRLNILKLPQDSRSEPVDGRGVRTDCIYCAAVFQSKASAYRHALDSHSDIQKFSCRKCALHFLSEGDKKCHLKKFHRHGIRCHACEKFVPQSVLIRHISEKHFGPGQTSFECCGKKFADQESLGDHFKVAKMHTERVCVYCNKSFFLLESIIRHIKMKHSHIAVQCHYTRCGKFFESEDEKQRHLSEVHESKPGTVPCAYCECTILKNNMLRHVRVRHQSQAIRCTFSTMCRAYFKSEAERKEHEREVHFRTKLRHKLNCLKCGKSICNRQHLKVHFRTTHQLEPRFCRFFRCREYFLRESELQNHFVEKHAADEAKKPFKCDECSYASHHSAKLLTHVQNMHATGNFECSFCEKIFTAKCSLRNHITAAHAEHKKCSHCGETPRYLDAHLRVTPCRKCKFVAPCTGLRKLHKEHCKHAST